MAPSVSWMASKSWSRTVSVELENRPHMALLEVPVQESISFGDILQVDRHVCGCTGT